MGLPKINGNMREKFAHIIAFLSKAPLHPEEGIPEGLSESDIFSLEERLGMKLPPQFRDWLTVTNAPCVGSGGFVGHCNSRKALDIESIYINYPEWKQKGWIPVVNDGSGNFYVLLGCGSQTDIVAYVDVAESPSELAFVAASSLIKFIELFTRRESGEKGWPFDRDFVLENDPKLQNLQHIAPFPWQ